MNLDWKELLKLRSYDVLGLDIGSSSVKIVQLHKINGSYAVSAAGIAEIADSDEDIESHNGINTARAIYDCLQWTGVETQFAVCSVSGPEAAVRCFRFPLLPAEEIKGAVLLEAEQVCPFNVHDSAIDYQLIPDGQDSMTGVLVAATNKLIKRKSQLADEVSLTCALMDVDGLALLNCFNNLSFSKTSQDVRLGGDGKLEAEHTAAILNVGSSYTNLAIMGNNGLPFVRDIAYAGNNIIKQIAEEKNLSTQAVVGILTGGERPNDSGLEVADSLGRSCQKLIVDVGETLRYYTAQEKLAVVDKVFVCGGFALVKGFVELLDNELGPDVVLWNPFEAIGCDAGLGCREILERNAPAFAVAAGLAMRLI